MEIHIKLLCMLCPAVLKCVLLTFPRRCFYCGSVLLFVFRVCRVFLSVRFSLVITCWERADLLALLCVMLYCGFVTFPSGVVLDCINF